MICPHCEKLGFNIPMRKEDHSWRCRLCNYKTEEEKADEGTKQENTKVVR